MDFEDKKITIDWSVDDGYVGKDRPQKTVITISDYFDEEEWNEMSQDEKDSFIRDEVEEDFNMKVSYDISNVVID